MPHIATLTRLDERYWIVLGACLTQFMVIGLLFSYGLFFKIFETEFGWSRTLLSGCMSLAFLVMGALAFFGGRLSDRYGPRPVLGGAGVFFGLGFILMAWITEPWQLFVLMGLFVGVGLSTHDVVTLSTVARWFEKRRGIMTGVAKVGTAAGQMAVPPVAAMLIAVYGWQTALTVLGVAGLVLLVAAAAMMKGPPETASPVSLTAPARNATAGFAFQQARRSSSLWMLCAIQFLFFPTLTTIPLHIVVHGMDLGMNAAEAAVLLTVVGAASVAGRLVIGTLVDRIGGKRSLVLCLLPLIASLAAFLLIDTAWILFPAVALYGFAHGGLFTVISPTVAELFGLRAHGAIFGLVLFFGTIGGAAGPVLSGWVFDVTQSYTLAFAGLAAMLVLGLALVARLPARDLTGVDGVSLR